MTFSIKLGELGELVPGDMHRVATAVLDAILYMLVDVGGLELFVVGVLL